MGRHVCYCLVPVALPDIKVKPLAENPPLKAAGVLEVSNDPVQAQPLELVPLKVVPETKLPEIVPLKTTTLGKLISAKELDTITPFESVVKLQLPLAFWGDTSCHVPEYVPAFAALTIVVNAFSAADAVTSVAPGSMALTAVCSCASVAVAKFSVRFAAAWSSLAVIVSTPVPGVVLIDCRKRAMATTLAVAVLAEESLACTQLSGVIKG